MSEAIVNIQDPIYLNPTNVDPAKVYSGTIEVGTVETLAAGEDATVENVGTVYAAKFNFGIPKGTDGVIGADGVGIDSIELTGTLGLVKTYTITFTDATTTTFDVTDGADGETPVISFVGTVIYVDGVAGPDLKGDPGDPGDPGPNEVSTSTTTDITGLLKGDGNNIGAAVPVTDYMPGYNLNTMVAWVELTPYVVGDLVFIIFDGIENYYICNTAHTSTTVFLNDESNWSLLGAIDTRIDAVTGIVKSDGEGGITAAVGAIDFMPAYDLNDFTEWTAGIFELGDKRYQQTELTTNIYIQYFFICIEDHTGTTGPVDGDSDKWISVAGVYLDNRLENITGIPICDGTGGVTAAAQSDIEALLTGEITSHTHSTSDEIEFSLINAWRY